MGRGGQERRTIRQSTGDAYMNQAPPYLVASGGGGPQTSRTGMSAPTICGLIVTTREKERGD